MCKLTKQADNFGLRSATSGRDDEFFASLIGEHDPRTGLDRAI